MYLYEARRKGQMDKATSIAEARRDGIAEGKAETARRFKELGVDVDILTRATGLSKDEIEAL